MVEVIMKIYYEKPVNQHFHLLKQNQKMADYIPKTDDALIPWSGNFKSKYASYAGLFGIDAATVTLVGDKCDKLTTSILAVDDIQNQAKKLVQAKEDLKAEVIGDLRAEINRIKANANFTTAIGHDLDIIAIDALIDWSTAKPQLSITTSGGQVTISFKKGKSNGIKIYSKRGSEANASFLAIDTHSPYLDARPNAAEGLPETRQYFAYFIDSEDAQVGLVSDTASVMV